MSLRHYLVLLLVAVFVTRLSLPLVMRIAWHYGIVDMPGPRRINREPIPRPGGIAIFLGIAASVALQIVGEKFWGWGGMFTKGGVIPAEILGIFGGMLVIFVTGLIDDIVDLSPSAKLVGQIVAAAIVVWTGTRIDYVGNPIGGGLIDIGTLAVPATLLYIIGFTNVINFIDGLDGLAAGISTIAAVSMLVVAIGLNRLDAAALAVALIGGSLAFLRFNFNPASVFMGDSGALLLGFTLSTISLLGIMRSTATIALLVPLLILGVPILDAFSAVLRRVRGKRPIQEADRGHLHHRFLNRGFTQRQTVVIVWIWSAALALGGYAVSTLPAYLKLAAFGVLLVISIMLASWLGIWDVVYHHDGTASDAWKEPRL